MKMTKLLYFGVILLAILGFHKSAQAGVFMCNDTANKIYVAIGYQEDKKWYSQGWFTFKPRECNALRLGVPQNRYFYYFAETESQKSTWGGKNSPNAGFFCTSDKVFHYENVDTDCPGKNFKRIDLNGADQYTFTLTEGSDPKAVALNCQSELSEGRESFARCWMHGMATEKQAEILNCWDKTDTKAAFAICANRDRLTQQQYEIANCAAKYNADRVTTKFARCISQNTLNESDQRLMGCALNHKGDYRATLECAALSSLSDDQKRIYNCVSANTDSYVQTGVCLAGDRLSPEQQRITGCVLKNRGSYTQMGVCAAGGNLSPEQQAFVSCAMQTGGQPYAFAGCVGTQLTLNELDKCMTQGIGGDGCFGDNNTVVKLVSNAFKDISEGPGPSNDLLGKDGWVGRKAHDIDHDIHHGPGNTNDIVGCDGFVVGMFGGC
ncbi:DUF1036 domain-containing protein [Pseudomonas sp. LB3P81]